MDRHPPQAHEPAYWLKLAQAETRATLRAVPEELRVRLRDVPVLFEARPSPRLLNEGWEDDLLGLFEGANFGETIADGTPHPPTITLFLDNLRDAADDDPQTFRQEVRTTLLHEIGHFLGLEEEDLIARDLE